MDESQRERHICNEAMEGVQRYGCTDYMVSEEIFALKYTGKSFQVFLDFLVI